MNRLFRYIFSIIIVFVALNICTNSDLLAASALKMLNCDTMVVGKVNDEVKVVANITNTSMDTVSVKLKVNIIELAPTHTFLICFPPSCFPFSKVGETIFEGSYKLAPGVQMGNNFTCSVSADSVGTSIASFTFYNNSDPTDFVSFTTTVKVVVTAVDDNNTTMDNFSISPNPACDLLNITLPNITTTGINEIKIFDMTGNNMLSQQVISGVNQQSFNISSLSSGIYGVAYLSNGTIKEVRKVAVVR